MVRQKKSQCLHSLTAECSIALKSFSKRHSSTAVLQLAVSIHLLCGTHPCNVQTCTVQDSWGCSPVSFCLTCSWNVWLRGTTVIISSWHCDSPDPFQMLQLLWLFEDGCMGGLLVRESVIESSLLHGYVHGYMQYKCKNELNPNQ